MIIPCVAAWIEKASLLASEWIDADDIWTFVIVAVTAGPCKLSRVVGDLIKVLAGNDVVNVEYEVGKRCFRKATVFAAPVRAALNEFAGFRVHALFARAVNTARFGLHKADNLRVIEIRSVRVIFFW